MTGAGRGIGAATAVALAQMGADVVVSARSADQLAEVAATIEGLGAGRSSWRPTSPTSTPSPAWPTPRPTPSAARHRGQQRRAAPCPARSWTPASGYLARRLQLQRPHRPRADQGGRARHAGRRRRIGRQHLVGHGSPGRAAGYAAYGTAKGALSHWTRAGRRRPVAAHPGQRHRGRLDRHLGARHRARRRGHERRDGSRPPCSGASAIPTTSPPPSCGSARRPRPTSPASSSPSTAACNAPTSTSASPISDRRRPPDRRSSIALADHEEPS